MDCSLWLNRCKVNDAAEIAEHFDIAALRGYFLGGSLAEWLSDHGGKELAEKVMALDPADPELNQRLSEIFGKKAAQKPVFVGKGISAPFDRSSGFGSYSFGSGIMAGSFPAGSFSLGSGAFLFGSGIILSSGVFLGSGGSYLSGSFSKFHMWEWEWEWRLGGSFRGGSFGFGSYVFGSGAYLLGSGGYLFGSGGYLLGSGAYLLGSFAAGSGAFRAGSFGLGSFVPGVFGDSFGKALTPDEYDRIMYETLRRCPLNCFGYGIHII